MKRVLLFFPLWLLILYLTPVEGRAGSRTPPPSDEVREEHRNLLKKYGFEKRLEKGVEEASNENIEPSDTGKRKDISFSEFAKLLRHLSLPLIIVIILVFAALFYFTLRGVPRFFPGKVEMSKNKKTGKGDRYGGPQREFSGDDCYKTALELARKGEFGSALIFLHRSTLKKLQESNVIPRGEHFTNNEIKGMIRDSKTGIYSPFTRLATAAERVAFKREEPAEETYLGLKQIYENTFLKPNRKKG